MHEKVDDSYYILIHSVWKTKFNFFVHSILPPTRVCCSELSPCCVLGDPTSENIDNYSPPIYYMNNLLATGVCCSELSPCCVIGDPTSENRNIDIYSPTIT